MFTTNGEFHLDVLVDNTQLPLYFHQGEVFIEGIKGRSFTLRVGKKDYQRRALAVISIDGLSIHDGKPAHSKSRGYVLGRDTWEITIPGWRLNDDEVAAFYFAEQPHAYAAQIGKPANIGVIGVKFWYEEAPAYEYEEYDSDSSYPPPPPYTPPLPTSPAPWGAPPAPGSAPTSTGTPFAPDSKPRRRRSAGLGTGFGKRMDHHVTNTDFTRDESTLQTLVLRYDTPENLEARGIILDSRRQQEDKLLQANPFPADDTGCTPPPGWKGR